ncbi:hypothetical protein [Methylobacterium sp. J-077]|uniref:hypothetical protein n=1 Tax=Methylobacterium sp. J-077 TaxID=2836656 RepID=UPI001FBAB10C|nr:hypothetical protein [Methylobacterium sp. J-077]MCJ2121842.1 hypothetical protein [Methylobacterium sp. J-077]
MNTVAVLDTSFLCCYLCVVGKETCGEGNLYFDPDRAKTKLDALRDANVTFVLPLASIIETGNHIANSPSYRFERATDLVNLLSYAAQGSSPWASFEDQRQLWAGESLDYIVKNWPAAAARKSSMGDHTIRLVADYYSRAGLKVQILTGDRDLSSYVPEKPKRVPRRQT